MTPGGRLAGTARVPVRTCVGCRGTGERSALVRVVARSTAGGVDREGRPEAVVDERAVMAGRGAWLHPARECLDLALRRRALPRALRAPTVDTAPVQGWFDQRERGTTTGPGTAGA